MFEKLKDWFKQRKAKKEAEKALKQADTKEQPPVQK